MQQRRVRLLQGPEAGEIPEPTLDPSLVAKPSLIRHPAKVAKRYPMEVEQDFAFHESATTLEDAGRRSTDRREARHRSAARSLSRGLPPQAPSFSGSR